MLKISLELLVIIGSFGIQYANSEGKNVLPYLGKFIELNFNSLGELCLLYESCGKCLTADPICSWCIDSNYDMKKPRCGTQSRLEALNCKDIYYNTPTQINVQQNNTTHDFTKDSLDAVQIQPQKVKITLKRGNLYSHRVFIGLQLVHIRYDEVMSIISRADTKISNEISSG